MSVEIPWTVYRTRFLVSARQLTASFAFTDALGRRHSGQAGDYLVEYSEGLRSITPRAAFEDIYVPLNTSSATPLKASPAIHATVELRTRTDRSRSVGEWMGAQS